MEVAKLAILHSFVLVNLFQVYDVFLRARQADLGEPARLGPAGAVSGCGSGRPREVGGRLDVPAQVEEEDAGTAGQQGTEPTT